MVLKNEITTYRLKNESSFIKGGVLMCLRKVGLEDKDMIREWRNSPEVSQYMYSDDYITPEIHESWFKRILNDPTCQYWIITYKNTGVGVANICDINKRNKRCFWAYYIAEPSVRGKGVGAVVEYEILRYVFEELEFNRLCCEVLSFNEMTVKTHESFGFKKEGYFRKHIYKGGIFHDVVSMAILREDWEEIKPKIEPKIHRIKARLKIISASG